MERRKAVRGACEGASVDAGLIAEEDTGGLGIFDIEICVCPWYTGCMDMNILGLYANTKMLEREDVFRHFFYSLSKERQQKIEAIRADGGRRSSLGGWTLIDYGLRELYGLREREVTIGYGAHGKPCVQNEPHIHFNLSHSGDYVLAAFAPVEVGCDIQQTVQHARSEQIAARFFTEEEQRAIADGMDFYRVWARKESYIKCSGEGMSCDLRSFSVVEDSEQAQEADAISEANDIPGTKIYFAEHDLPGYEMAICYKNREPLPVIWKGVDLERVLQDQYENK